MRKPETAHTVDNKNYKFPLVHLPNEWGDFTSNGCNWGRKGHVSISSLPQRVGKLFYFSRKLSYVYVSISSLPQRVGKLHLQDALVKWCDVSISSLPQRVGKPSHQNPFTEPFPQPILTGESKNPITAIEKTINPIAQNSKSIDLSRF
ncbi:hypothetical protein [Mastigocoleus testarum]|uniref:Uncharacterized protein n=1 Tax=Mastigocoleus testarum BC008 TaxID=371196 RepID=A0A0V7ZWR9_9CYAN|nr:hypothetical protein [Mastigocoleus testarum]KST69040.1 hypothetical protein BC008_02965 [Mastigocoleus testarum BC008]